jgi:hypothetical protein
MPTAHKRFEVAGIAVSLRGTAADALSELSAYYDEYPYEGDRVDLAMTCRYEPGFTAKPSAAQYPGFDSELLADGRVSVWRSDARGAIALPGDASAPVVAEFTLGSPLAIEAAIRISMSVALPWNGGVIAHASAVAVGDEALVFSGPSGAGKSTISDMLAAAVPDSLKLSDDLMLLRPAGEEWIAHVAPFHGVQGLPHGRQCPVRGYYFISHGRDHVLEPLTPAQALPRLLRNILAYVSDPRTAAHVLAAGEDLVHRVPCHSLAFRRDPDVAQVLGVA